MTGHSEGAKTAVVGAEIGNEEQQVNRIWLTAVLQYPNSVLMTTCFFGRIFIHRDFLVLSGLKYGVLAR